MHVLCVCVCVCRCCMATRRRIKRRVMTLGPIARGQCSHVREGILDRQQTTKTEVCILCVTIIGSVTHHFLCILVYILLLVLRYTTSWTARPNHHSLYSVPLPTSSPQCPPSVSRSSSHCYHIGRGLKVTSRKMKLDVWVQRTKVSQKCVWPVVKLLMWWKWTLSVETWKLRTVPWQYYIIVRTVYMWLY